MNALSDADSLSFFEPIQDGPDFRFEKRLIDRGRQVAGIDEAGRGPLAGPVVAAAVVLDPAHIPAGINDSKKLTAKAREMLFSEIASSARFGWCAVGAARIDEINILQATMLAMTGAARALPRSTDAYLIDGRDVPIALRERGSSLIGGDARSVSIAAASIVAKVIRDRIMRRAHSLFPEYGFLSNAGYGTRAHLDALKNAGPCALHRTSFAPVRALLPERKQQRDVSSACS